MGNIVLTDLLAPEPAHAPQPVTPLANTAGDVLKLAIERGADTDQLERLLNTTLRWRAYEADLAFLEAFTQFKLEPELKIWKDEVVAFTSRRTNERTSYAYSPLDRVEDVAVPLLAAHGITHRWRTETQPNGWVKVTCVLRHVLGHTQDDTSLMGPPDQTGSKNPHQAIGSNTSYLERYTLCAAIGVTPRNVDKDARVAVEEEEEVIQAEVVEQPAANLTPELEESVKQVLRKKLDDASSSLESLKKLWASLTEEQREFMKPSFSKARIALQGAVCK